MAVDDRVIIVSLTRLAGAWNDSNVVSLNIYINKREVVE